MEESERGEFGSGTMEITSKEELARELSRLRELAGSPTFDRLAYEAYPRSMDGRHPSVSTVRNWFKGTHAPRDGDALRRMVIWLVERAGVAEPTTAVAEFVVAYERIDDARQDGRRQRVPVRPASRTVDQGSPSPESATATIGSDPTSSAPPELPGRSDLVPPTRRGRVILPVVISLLVGVAAGFGVTRFVAASEPPGIAPCAESVRTNHAGGYVVLSRGHGPPGDAYPGQRVELRVQAEGTTGWVVYSYLAQAKSDRDHTWLDWSDHEAPTSDQVRRCDGAPINQVRQTAGLRARDPQGVPRWFRACASVPSEFQVTGRSPNNCTSWDRPDD